MKKLLLILFTAFFLFSSCHKDDIKNDKEPEDFLIDKSTATLVAQRIFDKGIGNKLMSTKGLTAFSQKKIFTNKEIKGKNGTVAYYIINYQGGGFAIISADKREMPVLAYSETNPFPTDSVPTGIDEWLYTTKNIIDEIRDDNVAQRMEVAREWDIALSQSQLRPPPCNPCCENSSETKGPLTITTWDQTCGYNNFMPQLNCNLPCDHAYTGCVATAMAQIMRFHQFPTNYNWSIMQSHLYFPDYNSNGSNEISQLMVDAATSVHMDYTCEGSGSDTKNEVINALRNFGYSTDVHYLDYSGTSNYDVVVSEIRANRPVIFRGGRKDNWLIFPVYVDGHAWICDGFNKSFYCFEDGSGGAGYLSLSMNWGWGGNHNGFYAFNNFSNLNGSFNYKTGVIVGIHP